MFRKYFTLVEEKRARGASDQVWNPPRHEAAGDGGENLDAVMVNDDTTGKDTAHNTKADESTADAAREDGGEMSADARNPRDEFSLEEDAPAQDGCAEDAKESVGDDSSAETGTRTRPNSAQDSVLDSAQDRDCVLGSRVKKDARPLVVEAPQIWHKDWKSWLEYLDDYCEKTKQVIPTLETMGRAERNRRLQKTKKGLDEAALVPEGLDPYQRTYICTHGWPERKSRGSGKRPRHHIRETDCPFRLVVQWQQRKGKWQLGVKLGRFYHNHPITGAAYATFPCARGVSVAKVGARVEGMLAVGAKRSRIYDYLLEHDQNVIKADVDNMVQDFATSVSSLDDNDATAAEIGALAAAKPENCVSIAETETGETGVISLSTALMRKAFSRFGEVLHNYQLLTFMVMNEFGEWVVVQHSLIEANGDWHMDRAIEHFKRAHPDGLKLLRVIIVDKDMNEVRVMRSHFPEARVLICHFHVIKYLKEKRAKPEFGKVSSGDASQVDASIHKMVYARSQTEYDTVRESLRGLCSRIGLEEFCKYFTKNWDSCQDMWVMHWRAKLPHFKNHTNNRHESFFGKLKGVINSSMSMAQCVEALVAGDKRAENEYKYRLSRIGRFVNTNYDEEMSNVLRFTTHFVAEQIEPQYAAALTKAEAYVYEPNPCDPGEMKVRAGSTIYTVNTTDWRCDCEFSRSMRLPCRHAIAYRRHTNLTGPVIPWCSIDERWTSPVSSLRSVCQLQYQVFDVDSSNKARKKPRTHADRYKEAVRATHLIASELADLADEDEFNEMLGFVLQQWRHIRQKQKNAVEDVPVVSSC